MDEIKGEVFYGNNQKEWHSGFYLKIKQGTSLCTQESTRMPQHLIGPTQFWVEFGKQTLALDTARQHSTDGDLLCTFVYQMEGGHRKFIVAHPEVYWWYSERMLPKDRCSYEVISENAPCRLYFDLEFQSYLNPESNGSQMTSTLIDIFCAYLQKRWDLPCDRSNVLSLDSTTSTKFSRHLIFSFRNIGFKNNLHVGRLVKSVYADIKNYLNSSTSERIKDDILDRFEKTDMQKLFVETHNGKKWFVDTGVYTRNRHFRLYKSTKWGKQSHLMISADSKYVPSKQYKDKELGIFLDSLISYFPTKKNILLLEFFDKNNTVNASRLCTNGQQMYSQDMGNKSQYSKLDEFVSSVVVPGKIRRCLYFESTKRLIYEIYGNRYCANIGRSHKSNNVFWVVDLGKNQMYQKCHDEDCAGFASQPRNLPENVCFELDKETDALLASIPEVQDASYHEKESTITYVNEDFELEKPS